MIRRTEEDSQDRINMLAWTKEVIKEQSTPANLSATARRVLRCTRSQKPSCSFKEIFFGYFHLTVPETASQKGFISVKQKVKNYTLGHFL